MKTEMNDGIIESSDGFWVVFDRYGSESSTGFSNTKEFLLFSDREATIKFIDEKSDENISIGSVDEERVREYHELDDESLSEKWIEECDSSGVDPEYADKSYFMEEAEREWLELVENTRVETANFLD